MPATGKPYTCKACGTEGHTARSKECPKRKTDQEKPAPKKRRAPKRRTNLQRESAIEERRELLEADATAIAKKLHWAIRGACDGHLTLDQLSDLAGGDDVHAVVG